MNYLSTIPGSYHVPLSYVVREQEDPDHGHDFGDDFVSEMIACAPLHGAHFRARHKTRSPVTQELQDGEDSRRVD